MRRVTAAAALLVAVTACADPETTDRRGYTKAPLEEPGLLVGGENASAMAALGRPDLPRPPLEIEIPGAEGEDAAEGGEAEVTLAQGVTQEQFDQGRQLFTGQGGCQACHGPSGGGSQLAPDLTDDAWLHVPGPDVPAIAEVIRSGVAQPVESPAPMPPMGGANLSAEQVDALAAYVASIAQG